MVNPLKRYKEKNGLTFDQLEDLTGITKSTIHKVTHYTLQEIKDNTTVGTYMTILEKLGVDITKF
jgi:transcriptional regulator with XRE-family HTH domain